ncbi:hypothetical protein MKW94_016073 [Papaver nudicaule]|uniref:Uncharacterized protein n=1 Tax=Papaver nudicaule TaxID=74823 RepID=A0AA42AW32_PAPNU|nr:hypothetical protein [Papaver nudicaule]
MAEVTWSSSRGEEEEENVAVATPHLPRKPRVREVSSRFMSPMVSTTCGTKCPLPKHSGELNHNNQNHLSENRLNVTPHFDTPPHSSKLVVSKPLRNFKENNGEEMVNFRSSKLPSQSRLGTPIVHGNDKISVNYTTMVPSAAAAKLVQSQVSSSNNLSFPSDQLPTVSSRRNSGIGDNGFAKPSGGVINLPPPRPSSSVACADTRKGKKILRQQEDGHSLKMLHNCHLQWRFTNARAAKSVNARTTAAEQSLYGLARQISEMRDRVKGKRVDFESLKRREALSGIFEAEIPCLDEWGALEGDYVTSLVEAVKGLQDASHPLQIRGGNVRADLKELDGALNSASNMMESISSNIESFIPKAEEVASLVSELAVVASEERALIEECGELLSQAQNLQVEECCLRGQLMQLKKSSSLNQAKKERALRVWHGKT